MGKTPRGRGAPAPKPKAVSRWVWVGRGPVRYALEWHELDQPTGHVEEFDGLWAALRFAESAPPPAREEA